MKTEEEYREFYTGLAATDSSLYFGGHHLYIPFKTPDFQEVCLSILAGRYSYSTPRENLDSISDYSAVEIGLLIEGHLRHPKDIASYVLLPTEPAQTWSVADWEKEEWGGWEDGESPVGAYIHTFRLTMMVAQLSSSFESLGVWDLRTLLGSSGKDTKKSKPADRFNYGLDLE
jgi:hypothetical protein